MFERFKAYFHDLWAGLNTKLTWFDIVAVTVLAAIDIFVGIPPLAWIPILLIAYLSGR